MDTHFGDTDGTGLHEAGGYTYRLTVRPELELPGNTWEWFTVMLCWLSTVPESVGVSSLQHGSCKYDPAFGAGDLFERMCNEAHADCLVQLQGLKRRLYFLDPPLITIP